MIHAVILDFDGLILDTETPLIESYGDVHRAHGIPFDRAAFLQNVGHADYTFDPWHGFSPHSDRAALEAERRLRKNDRLLLQNVLPGVADLLNAARAGQLRVGLASNSEHDWVEPHLARIGLLDRFEFLACRGDAASAKPEPDLYRLVLNHFGIRGNQAIAFEDSQTGVVAAKRAGAWVVAVPNAATLHHDLSPADFRFGSLADCDLATLADQIARRSEPRR